MKKFLKIVVSLLIVTAVFFVLGGPRTHADVGSFSSYSGGSSHSSSSSSHSSSSHSSYSSGSHSYSSGSSSSGGGVVSVLAFVVVFIFILIIAAKSSKKGSVPSVVHNDAGSRDYIRNPERAHQIAEEIRKEDTNFSEEEFTQFTKDLFVRLQTCWSKREWEEMRPFETPELFEQHKTQIDGYIKSHRINVMDRIAVFYSEIYKYYVTNDKEVIEVILNARMQDYIIDDQTQAVLQGNPQTELQNTYKLTFVRSKGVKTGEDGKGVTSTTNCPNCGAPTTVTTSGKCEFCGAVITTKEHGWSLSNLEPYQG